MSKKTALKLTALAAVFSATAVPMTAAAEISGNLSISNIYFWRGLDISGGTAQVAGGAQYDHSSGLYAGVWTSSAGFAPGGLIEVVDDDDLGDSAVEVEVGVSSGMEYDLYAGYGTEVGGVSFDISYWDYNYPGYMDFDLEEVVVGLGVAGINLTGYIGVGEVGHGDGATDNNSNYYTVDYSYDKYTAKVGTWDFENEDANYTHVDLSYAVTDSLALTVSKIVDEEVDDTYSDDALVVVSYSFSL